jgi:hypothetical protein
MEAPMKHLALLLLLLAAPACSGETVCDQYCDKIDECNDLTNAEDCKESYAASMSANESFTTAQCQDALDALDETCGDAS